MGFTSVFSISCYLGHCCAQPRPFTVAQCAWLITSILSMMIHSCRRHFHSPISAVDLNNYNRHHDVYCRWLPSGPSSNRLSSPTKLKLIIIENWRNKKLIFSSCQCVLPLPINFVAHHKVITCKVSLSLQQDQATLAAKCINSSSSYWWRFV